MRKLERKNYSYELQEVLEYMIDILATEFPTDVFTPEYLMVSILDTKKCHANVILDNYLTSKNIEELRDVYTGILKGNTKPIIGNKDNSSKVDFDFNLNKIMERAEIESDKTKSNQIGTEHVLLAILNPENEISINDIFQTVGIDYGFIFDKCKVSKRPSKSKKNLINNNSNTSNDEIKIIPLKSQISTTATVVNGEYTSRYTVNLNELVKSGKIDKLVGRERELNQIVKVLSRRKKNNVVLVGEGGVGKTSIVNGLAALIESGNVPTNLEGKQILSMDITALVSGTQLRGMFEERIKGLFDELKTNSKCILFIDDIQSVLKSSNKEKDIDLSGVLNSILAEGDTRVIGTSTFKEYRNSIENNPNIAHKLQKIIIEPSTVDDTIKILNECKNSYEEYHNVVYTDESIKKCVELAERYITDRCLPDSAFDVMDMTGAYVSISSNNNNEIVNLNKRVNEIETEKNSVLNNGDFEKIDALLIEESDVKKRIADLKRTQKKNAKKIKISEDDVAETVSEMVNIPIAKLSGNEKNKIANIDKILKADVIGQDEAIDTVCKVIKRNKVGLGNRNRVLGSFLLVGSTAVGKTLLAKKMAEEIFGDKNALVRIDMSEYSEKSSISKLIGSAPGYIGFENGGLLTESVKHKQHCVLLLDEVEKANEEIYNLFLQLFDEGRLTDGSGQLINFKNVIVMMTSNVGVKQANELGGGVGFTNDESSNKKAIIDKQIKQKFAPEFLNRIDKIVFFNDLTDDNLREIVKLEINNFNKRLHDVKYTLKYGDDVIDFIHAEALKQKKFGARPIIRLVQNDIEDLITDLMLENDYKPEYEFTATCKNDKIVIE